MECNKFDLNNIQEINTRDIVWYIGRKLINDGYYKEDIEGKKRLVEERLRNYLSYKLCDSVLISEIDKRDVNELIVELYKKCNLKRDIVDQVIHYILGLIGNFQGRCIIWTSSLVDKAKLPVIKEDDGLVDELVTSDDSDPIEVFNFVYDYFKNYKLDSELKRKRVFTELPKNGD